MKKILIITYYWPPCGGAGVQRNLKYVKYLREFGWEPVVFTAENAHYPVLDDSLAKDIPEGVEVIKGEIWEPYELYRKLMGMKKGEKVQAGFIQEKKKPSRMQELSVWVRGNLFIPDARKYWIKPSIKRLLDYLKENPVDAILSSGPPHSTHMIARAIKRKTGITWIADFRDPWTNIDFYHELKIGKRADAQHRAMEQSVIDESDLLLTVSWHWGDDFREMGAKKVGIVTNGYDPADFNFPRPPLDQAFTLKHIGSLNKDRNAPMLWKVLGEMAKEDAQFAKDLQIQFVGKTDYVVFEQTAKHGLEQQVSHIPYLPHNEVLKQTCSAQVLLLLLNETPNIKNVMGHIPGKTYEYLAANRPILCVAPPTADIARVVEGSGSGAMINFGAEVRLKEVLEDYYRMYKEGRLENKQHGIEQYSRKVQTGKMADLINKPN